jgi:hypothetical protein
MNINNNNSSSLPAGYTRRSIDTDTISFFNNDMMMQTRFLDRTSLSITFRPVQYIDGQRKFPKKEGEEANNFNVILNKENAITLSERINNYFIPKFSSLVDRLIEDPNSNPGTISTGVIIEGKTAKVLDITSGAPTQNGYVPTLRLVCGIGQNRVGSSIVEFKFDSGRVIDEYSPTTGEFQLNAPVFPQLILFKRLLEGFIWSLTSSASHDVNVMFKTRLKDLTDTVNQTAIKNGITPIHTTYGYTERKDAAPFAPAAAPVAEMRELSFNELMGDSSVF